MSKNPLRELERFGVSVWYDNISRGLIQEGKLARLIAEDGLTGVTSNPTIFEKAIGSCADYDADILALGRQGKTPAEIFEHLACGDVRAAADLFLPVYSASAGADGYVSLELPPSLAHDAARSARQAQHLHKLVGRPNVMIKIPGTVEGVAAFEEATAAGIPVNVTLLFSQRRYAAVVEAYLRGLERRAKAGQELSRLASVASFFVSRVDTLIDARLEGRGPQADALRGTAAIANAKLAYQIYKERFGSPRFAALREKGARPQRLLWASTSAKNPRYRDVVYVEELIGADTVNTMPPQTLDAFRDHGACRPALEEDVAKARAQWEALAGCGVDVAQAAERLEAEGLAAFAKSFETLLGQIAAKRELVEAEAGPADAGLARLKRERFCARLWAKDPSLWTEQPAARKIIKNALGWLTAPEAMAAGLGVVRAFAEEIRKEGFEDVLVLGMGGSSLCCEVFSRCFPVAKGHARLSVLDTTNPAAIASMAKALEGRKTLFIVSSKSGSTLEPNCLMDYFWAGVEKKEGAAAGRRFVAITDPGTSLEELARRRRFRKVFLNPADVGGRFCALTFFGLVPAALMGVDVERLLSRSREMARRCGQGAADGDNPALRLGAALGGHAAAGRDQLTLWLSPAIASFGLWVEQLLAESTGKEGRGILPVLGEPILEPGAYGAKRLLASVALACQPAPSALARLESRERPRLSLSLADAYDLGGQFFLWEAATAAAGLLLGVNPFDQPDVQSAKDQAKALLSSLQAGELPAEPASLDAGGLAGFADEGLLSALGAKAGAGPARRTLADVLSAHFSRLRRDGYAAVLAYVQPTDEHRRALEALAERLRALSGAPICLEFGPRYLHSTGQLYKGGGPGGVFLQLIESGGPRLPVPGRDFTFDTLHLAQGRGDFAALLGRGRPVLRLELGDPGRKPLQALLNAASALECRR